MPARDYDSPSFEGDYGGGTGGYAGYEDYGYGKSQQQPGNMMKYAPIIVVLLILAVGGYFAYDMFIGSVKEVTIEVNDTEGKPVDAVVKIFEAGKSTPVESFKGTNTVKLKRGEYTADISASGYKAERGFSFSVGNEDKQTQSVELEKNIKVNMTVVFPEQLVVGQEATASIELENELDEAVELSLVFEGDLDKKAGYLESIEYIDPIKLAPKAKQTETLKLVLAEKLKEKAKGTIEVKGKIRIMYTGKRENVSFNLIQFDSSKVKLSKTALDFGKVKSGEDKKIELSISHTNKDFTMKDISIGFEESSWNSSDNPVEDVKSWFSLSPEKIAELPYKESQTIKVSLEVPPTALKATITGAAVIKTDYWEKILNLDLQVEQAKVGLELSGLSDEYKLKRLESGEFAAETDYLEINNKGELSIESIRFSVSAENDCSNWVKIEGETSLDELKAGGKAKVKLKINPPANATEEQSNKCIIAALYINPLKPESTRAQTEIEITPLPK